MQRTETGTVVEQGRPARPQHPEHHPIRAHQAHGQRGADTGDVTDSSVAVEDDLLWDFDLTAIWRRNIRTGVLIYPVQDGRNRQLNVFVFCPLLDPKSDGRIKAAAWGRSTRGDKALVELSCGWSRRRSGLWLGRAAPHLYFVLKKKHFETPTKAAELVTHWLDCGVTEQQLAPSTRDKWKVDVPTVIAQYWGECGVTLSFVLYETPSFTAVSIDKDDDSPLV